MFRACGSALCYAFTCAMVTAVKHSDSLLSWCAHLLVPIQTLAFKGPCFTFLLYKFSEVPLVYELRHPRHEFAE